MARIKVYTMNYCPYCVRAKALLKQRGVDFEEILVTDDDEKTWKELESRSKMKTLPQVFDGERLIGGFTELSELDKKDQLASLKP